MLRIWLLVSLLVPTARVFGVEAPKAGQRYALVGVISEDQAPGTGRGVVVLRDLNTRRVLTLRTGSIIPNSGGLKVASIRRNLVVIRNGREKIELNSSDHDLPADEAPAQDSTKADDLGVSTKSSGADRQAIVEVPPPRIFLPSDGILTNEDVEAFNEWSEARYGSDGSGFSGY